MQYIASRYIMRLALSSLLVMLVRTRLTTRLVDFSWRESKATCVTHPVNWIEDEYETDGPVWLL